jgi:3-phenylpropionate/cinnamic acid dioxygenase small subunit
VSSSRTAVRDLVHRYAERLDAGDLAGVAQLFAEATYGVADGVAHAGADAVREALEGAVILYDGLPRTKHVITNLVIDLDEATGSASARSYFTVLQATPTLPLQPIAAGRYQDRFRRVDAAWRFVERRIHLDLIGDLREHLRARR